MVVIEGSKVKNPESIFGNGWEAYFYKEGHVYKNEATGPDLFCRYNYYELETLEELENAYKIYYRIGTEKETTIPDDVKKIYKDAYEGFRKRLCSEATERYQNH